MKSPEEVCLERCKANRDGECSWAECPQLRDNEPSASGRSCPHPHWIYDEDQDDAIEGAIKQALAAAEQRGLLRGRQEGREQAAKVAEETPLPHNEAYAARIRNLKD